jgi:hypothetical protein
MPQMQFGFARVETVGAEDAHGTGLCCEYKWPLDKAIMFDDSSHFVKAVRNTIDGLLPQLREPGTLPPPDATLKLA